MAGLFDYMNFPPQPTPIQNMGYDPEEEQINATLGNPGTLSGRIQEWLGAREPNQGGFAQNILSQRFQPSFDDSATGAVQTLIGGKPVSGQNIADERMKNVVDQFATLSRAEYLSKGGGSGSVFAQTMEAINQDPELANLSMMDKIRLAQNKVGTNLTMNGQGVVSDMSGAASGLGNLSYGEEMGTQNARVNTARPLAVQKGLGEADTASQIATNTALGKSTGEAMGGIAKREVNAPQVLNLVSQAEALLPKSTGSLAGRGSKFVTQQMGMSTEASRADKQLGVIANALTANVPRMEGPQSDYDVQLYQQAAGDVANTNVPYEDRLAALQTIRTLQQKYLNQEPQGQVSNSGPGFNLPAKGNSYTNDTGLPTDAPRQAPDGNFYIPDPSRQGKYLMVQP